MRHTVRAIILKDKHVLLVTGHGAGFYWTPGGKVEDGESIIQTLHREIKEELGATIKEYSHYYSFKYRNQEVDNFLVTINEEIKVGNEITGYVWYANDSDITPSSRFIDMLQPKLTNDNLII